MASQRTFLRIREQIQNYFHPVYFVLTSTNEMVAYHRQVCFAALAPLIYTACFCAAYSTGFIHTLSLRQTMNFVLLISLSYTFYVVRAKLLPKYKTFDQWSAHMDSVHHNPHTQSTLQSFHQQIQHGDAPADIEETDVPAKVYEIWRNKHYGQTPNEARTKYVNFCWRYTYKLWRNRVRARKHVIVTDMAHRDVQAHRKVFHGSRSSKEEHGDGTKSEAAEHLLPPLEYIKLKLLGKLAGRVGHFATIVQGDFVSSADEEELTERVQDDPIYKKLKAKIQAAGERMS